MSGQWSILPLQKSTSVPTLLVKHDFGPTNYTVQLTDLTYLWSETLDRRQIIRKSLNEDTSVDPSEDSSQLRILLQKLQGTLEGDEGTELNIEHNGDGNGLTLRAKSPLPPPLRPLGWPFHLIGSTQQSLTSKLVLPLLKNQYMQALQIHSLLTHIQDRDHVIGRLMDKLEITGVNLSMVFPGAAGLKAGKKGPGREKAAKYVKGLGEFEVRSWKKEMTDEHPSSMTRNDLVESLFAVEDQASFSFMRDDDSVSNEEEWWNYLGETAVAHVISEPSYNLDPTDRNTTPNARGARSTGQSNYNKDDECQRQITPSRLQTLSSRKAGSPSNIYGESKASQAYPKASEDDDTTGDDDLDQASTSLSPSKPQQGSVQSVARHSPLNSSMALRKRPDAAEAQGNNLRNPDASDHSQMPLKANYVGEGPRPALLDRMKDASDTNSSSGDEHLSLKLKPSESERSRDEQLKGQRTAASSRYKGRLGTIGGCSKDSPTEVQALNSEAVPSLPSDRTHKKLGVIRAKGKDRVERVEHAMRQRPLEHTEDSKQRTVPLSVSLGQIRPDSEIPSIKINSSAEAPQEKADRKREELKRQLEEKSKAPAKKKRKF
ncbi:MAG: hypothetical protein M1827_003825 [Pycnora praestabilis]|nr:MAG: hypothetical protein M1827_003825 [Pycnora praestabilis]